MKNIFTLLLMATLALNACTKDDTTEPVKLVVNVQDATNKNISGVTVSIYNDMASYTSHSNPKQTVTTGTDGNAEFNSLAAQVYYVYATKGATNNDHFASKTTTLTNGSNFFFTQLD
ncbi:MAG: SpaA isopeptide-forming pilin-related protein [Bacteroidetes bacterium]|nr:SpaA isopeptide-forming pilin-related protein [Bacteroidota bacterium]